MGTHICIVGAGVSGLRCATVLLENGFDVTILEARDRIGGRVTQSYDMGPIPVDIGANWVHSTGSNPIMELAKSTNTPVHLWRENTLIVDTKGELVESKRANDALKVVWQILEKAIENSYNSSADIDSSKSLYDFFNEECSALSQQGELSAKDVELVLRMSEMWGAYVGTRIERQSMKFFFLEDCIGGEDDCFVPSNYIKIMEAISSRPLADARIHLNTVVTSVQSVDFEHAPPKVKIETADGESLFDSVVVTAPLGWLKDHKQVIQPLSEKVSAAIDSISVGNLEKVLIEFPQAFWESAEGTTDDEAKISFVHWLSPEYDPKGNPEQWRLECVSFNAFPGEYRRNILLFYTFGDCSRHITSMIYGKDYAERSVILRDYFEPYYSRLPNYDENTCSPLRFLATEWSQDQYAGFGSYSNFQVGMTHADKDVETIRHGMPEHQIYFAGEHTAPFDGLGTVAGAYNSGEAVAHRIIEEARRGRP